MRMARLGLCIASLSILGGPTLAQGKPLPPPASDAMPPTELAISLKDGKPVCEPNELRLPADTNVALTIASTADAPVVLTMGEQFENGRVLHHDGDLGHVMSEKGFTVKQNGRGTLRLRTMGAGTYEYACTSTRNQSAPTKGKLVLTPPAG
ncbi:MULTISPECIES: anaerobic typically selenocysteine-containing protein [Methylobacterium]|uniref:Anaerobic typically selenocysteine-containing protein n=2 Tax=Methylobacterium TaxID=407 RepID=A0ABQ4SY53_9HYPH|nr:hypothetical protein AwMethylo_03400 [Methylobacterium sp.]GJE07156.1 hypothetical protein AOPFMNJM_2481 [Methylobacterium jeotgali]